MELDRLSLQNFRQFRDDSLDFAPGDDRNVTIVHGSNGSGKTTLLNAFTWLFYEDVDFDSRPDRLASEGAMAEADKGEQVDVSAELRFEHEDVTYVAERRAVYEKQSPTDFDGEMVDIDLTLRYRDGGGWSERNNPSNFLDQIIPERLSGLFFFDGEDIDELAGIDNQERIQEAIQNIMGLTILERSVRHLDEVAGRFEDEVAEYASDELSQLIEEKREIEDEIDDEERKRQDTDRAIERIETEIRNIEQKLERLGESAALQERREEYRKERGRLESEVKDIEDDLRKQISEAGFTTLAMPLLNETAEDLDGMRKKGLIPSELSNSYIDSLLDSGTCLCGRSLEAGTEHYERVEAMKGEAITDGVEQSALRIISHLNEFTDKREDFFEETDELIEKRMELNEEIADYEELIDEISSELKGLDQITESGESVSDLEETREQRAKERDQKLEERGSIEERIESKEEELEEVKQEIEERRDERDEALLAKRRQKATELVREEIEESFADLKDRVRQRSNVEVKERFQQIASKDLVAEITEDFKLKIWQDVDDRRVEVDKSTGERQIASLAFIGSLVNIAKERYESAPDAEYFSGGIYPLVMDSPFGALDKSHRREVSRVIPTLANQVVVFATDSQWEGPVEEEMSSIAGNNTGSTSTTERRVAPLRGQESRPRSRLSGVIDNG